MPLKLRYSAAEGMVRSFDDHPGILVSLVDDSGLRMRFAISGTLPVPNRSEVVAEYVTDGDYGCLHHVDLETLVSACVDLHAVGGLIALARANVRAYLDGVERATYSISTVVLAAQLAYRVETMALERAKSEGWA